MSDDWTHSVCDTCWNRLKAFEPVRARPVHPDVCCFCGIVHRSGIYIRQDPTSFRCRHAHPLTYVKPQSRG